MFLNSISDYFFNICRTNTVSTFDAVRPRFKVYQDALELLQIQGKVTADGKLVIPEEAYDKEELQPISGLNKLTSSGGFDLHARQAALGLDKAFILTDPKNNLACANKTGVGGYNGNLRRRFHHTILRRTSSGIFQGRISEPRSRLLSCLWLLTETRDQEAQILYVESISMEELTHLKDAEHRIGMLVHSTRWIRYTLSRLARSFL